MTLLRELDNEAVEMTEASDILRGLRAFGVLGANVFPLIFPLRGAAVVEPPSVFMLVVDVVDAIEMVLPRGTGGTSKSSLALLKDTSETLELGLESDAVDRRGAGLLDVEAVLLRASIFALALSLGDVGETAVELVPPRRIVDVVDLTEAAIDLGRPAAGLSAAEVVLVATTLRPGTFLAGGFVETVGDRAR